jgi:hypothetical protein
MYLLAVVVFQTILTIKTQAAAAGEKSATSKTNKSTL